MMRKYLNGSTPGVDKAAQIAEANGVTLLWLATGKGPMRTDEARPDAAVPVDMAELALAIETVEEGLAVHRRTMTPAKKAELICAVYDLWVNGEEEAKKNVVLRLVASAA